ncbi:MAG: biopolymer transporter ExbD [Nitrospinaceae bacterium]|jgi:biopolymer transport protein ExbD|nr:MAG: biopolymer transporter ExbD [Nitrospinaceae bacterium]
MRFRSEEEENFGLDLTPLIDVVFLLLIFFMVSTVFVDFNRRLDLKLPTSKASVPDESPKSLEIEMTVDKQVYFNGKKISLDELEARVGEFARLQKQTAIIRADKSLPYGEVVRVMGALQGAGILDISVAVK